MEEKPKTKLMEDGRLAFLDEQGNVTSIQAENKRNVKRISEGKSPWKRSPATAYYTRYNKNGVPFMLPGAWKGLEHKVRDLPDDYSYFDNYTELLLEIAARIGEGKTLSEIEKDPKMPPARAILFWESHDTKFRAIMEAARRARAEKHADKVLEIADQTEEFNAKSSKVKIDAYKWRAEVEDKEKFGGAKSSGNPNVAINFTFNTGIDRSSDAKHTIEISPEDKNHSGDEAGEEEPERLPGQDIDN